MTLAGVTGVVEDVNLRRTLLRDQDGTVHSVPHGSIMVSSNQTRLLSRVSFLISVQHDEDLERVFDLINRTGSELAGDPDWSAAITLAPRALGVDNLRPGGVDVRISGETVPNRQWEVMREMRRRLVAAFQKENIKLAAS